uniref:Methyltransferase-like protein 6 n=1 Tax=Aegilops tauschii TaxID=37682 RepID=R7W2E0_AEGTA
MNLLRILRNAQKIMQNCQRVCLRCSPSISVYACDCSEDTLEKANEIVGCSANAVKVQMEKLLISHQIFMLSAIPFNTISATLERCMSVLKPGGLVLFRDYGVYDMTMLRFLPHQRVGFREYMRADGTYSYFFSLDTVRELFHAAGLLELELEYCCVRSVNRKNGKNMQRFY